MEPTGQSSSLATDIIKSAGAAAIPTFFAFLITTIAIFMVPDNEVRFIPSLINDNSAFIILENHSNSLSNPVKISLSGAGEVKLLKQSSFANITITNTSNSLFSIIEISDALPNRRTILLIYLQNSSSGATFSLANTSATTKIIKGEDLSENSLPKSFWASIFVQTAIYFLAFLVMNMMRKKSAELLQETKDKLKEARLKLDQEQALWQNRLEKMQQTVHSFKTAYVKRRLYTTRIYEKIERENEIWRSVVLVSLSNILSGDRVASKKVLNGILSKFGLGRTTLVSDVNLELFIKALEAEDEKAFMQAEYQYPDMDTP